jgi:large subunit ribosomal protein L25
VDISSVGIGDTLTVADLVIGEDYKILNDLETTVLTVAAPRVQEEVVEEEEEGEELAEPEVIQKGKKEEEEE